LKIKAIVADMDGTITKFNLDYMNTRQRILEELDKKNLRTPDMNDQLSLFIVLGKLKDRLDVNTFEALRGQVYGYLEEMELKAATDVTLYPGVMETLQKLRSDSIKIGLVTNNGRKGTALTLSRYRLENLFDAIVTRDDCDDMKPAAEPVLKVLIALNVKPSEAILIGDGIMDVVAAKAAGVLSIAVATGPFASDHLLEAEPDYLLGSINDLPTLIDSLNTTE
jgi:HAD superfamily hydrolase (TIGR01509 family)